MTLLLAYTAIFTTSVWGQMDHQKRNRVSVIAVDSFGKPFGDFTVMSFQGDDKKELRDLFKGPSAEGIPLGSYSMTLKFSKGWQLNEKVAIDRPECVLIISGNPFHVDYPKGRAPVLNGQVMNWQRESARSRWIKICGLFTSECVASEIDQEGRFSFFNLTPAAYVIELLSVSGGGRD